MDSLVPNDVSQQLTDREPKDSHEAIESGLQCEELEKVIIGSDEGKYFQVGTQLALTKKEELLVFLRRNIDVFG